MHESQMHVFIIMHIEYRNVIVWASHLIFAFAYNLNFQIKMFERIVTANVVKFWKQWFYCYGCIIYSIRINSVENSNIYKLYWNEQVQNLSTFYSKNAYFKWVWSDNKYLVTTNYLKEYKTPNISIKN